MHNRIQRHEQAPRGSSNRSFGLIFAAFFLIIALLPLLRGGGIWLWAVGVSCAFGGVALVIPSALAQLNRLWTKFGLLMHRIISPVALAILFYGVVTPNGLLMRIFGKYPLRLRMDRNAASYWIERTPPGPAAESLKNQF